MLSFKSGLWYVTLLLHIEDPAPRQPEIALAMAFLSSPSIIRYEDQIPFYPI